MRIVWVVIWVLMAGPSWAQCLRETMVGPSPVSSRWLCASEGDFASIVAPRPGDTAVATDTGAAKIRTAAGTWASAGGGGAAWGGITGTLSAQTDLQAALDGKQAAGSYATAAQGALADSALQPSGNGGALTGLTKAQVGLGNVDNTADATKPISAATQAALDGKLGATGNGSGLTGLTKSQVGLGNVDNTADASKPVSTAMQAALDGKLGTTGNGSGLTGLTKAQVGLGSVDNTADSAKAVASAATLTTPRTINGVSFNGSANITVTAAGSTLSDNVPVSKLNGGTGASSATFWRGDGTWATPAGGGGGPSYVVTVADTTNATTSYANITGLSFAVSASTRYRVSCVIPYDANATTTGIGIGWTGPASPTLTRGLMVSGLTAATVGGTTSVGNDTGGVTTASVATTGNMAHFEGLWSNGVNAGTVQMRVKSEVAVANAIIVRTGAMCSYAVY